MPMSGEDIAAVRADFASASTGGIRPLGNQLLKTLFANNPETKPLYARMNEEELTDLGEKIFRNLRVCIVDQLDRPEIMAQDLKTLGSRHPGYGVDPEVHSRPMRDAIFNVIRSNNGGNLNESAWAHLWSLVACGMGLFVRD